MNNLQPIVTDVESAEFKYVEDYTKRSTKTQFVEEDQFQKVNIQIMNVDGKEIEFKTNTTNSIDVQHNQLAFEVMRNQSIEITDQRIEIKSIKNDIIGAQFNQIDLGEVYVTPKNTVHITEIDVNKIPEDLDIQLDREVKQLYAVGTQSNEDAFADKLNIEKTIIEDITFQEFKDENLFKFEQYFVVMNKKAASKFLIRCSPLIFTLYVLVFVWLEERNLYKQINEIEIQELKSIKIKLLPIQNKLLINDPLFKRV
ncbi:hypothetical protein pb186bvf_012782 [Paramecium bursaria]